MENSLSRHLGYRPRYASTDVWHVRDEDLTKADK